MKGKTPKIEISFKKNELNLLYRIETRCKLICISGWLKEAAMEKLEREENDTHINSNQQLNIPNANLPINNSAIDNLLNSFDF